MPRQRILQIIPTLDQSGAEKQLSLLACHLPKDRFEVAVCAITRGGYYEQVLREHGIPVHVLAKRFKWDPRALLRLYRCIADFKPDIVQTWLFAGNSYGRVAAKLAKVPHIIASERCVDSWKGSYQFAIDRRLVHWTDVVVANSQAVSDFYVRQVGLPAEKMRVIPNAAVVPQNNGTDDTLPIREELHIGADETVIGFVGRLWPQKRVHDLIWATDVLRIAGWKIHLLVVGEGPRKPALERFARNLELQDHVHFLGHRQNVATLLRQMDVLVLPSKFEGMPNVALEAMHLGTPVVATDIPGMSELIIDGVTGLLVPPCKPFALAKAIDQLLRDPARRSIIAEAARDRVTQHFSVERMVSAYQQLYEALA